MDYLIIAIATLSGLYFHWWLFVRIRRWTIKTPTMIFFHD